ASQWRRIAVSARSCGHLLFNRYLLLTNCAICGLSSSCGDLISQKLECRNRKQSLLSTVNWKRNLTIGSCGVLLGPLTHYWYLFLERRFLGRTARALVYKVAADALLFSPVYITLYVVSLGLMRGVGREAIKADLWEAGLEIYKYEATIWSAAQAVNFYFLPIRYRVAFDSSVSLAFDTFYANQYNSAPSNSPGDKA
ncbi:hypothetical protein BOX15_Mlig015401g2, partial [Macrostomum lignano]